MTITEMLAAQRKGRCLTEANEKLKSLVKECVETGKKGKFSLSFEIRPTAETVTIIDTIDAKAPKAEVMGSTFFADEEGNLSRNNPRQTEMFEAEDNVTEMPPKAANA